MDIFDKAVEEEDRGDRWLSSGDVRKAARFFSRAIDMYEQAIGRGESVVDSVYNILRIKSVMWGRAIKPGELEQTAEQADGKWPKSARQLAQAYDEALRLVWAHPQAIPGPAQPSQPAQAQPSQPGQAQPTQTTRATHPIQPTQPTWPRDLGYNYAQALREAGEEAGDGEDGEDGEAMEWVERACRVVEEMLCSESGAEEQEVGEMLVVYLECICQGLEICQGQEVSTGCMDAMRAELQQKGDAAAARLVEVVRGTALADTPDNTRAELRRDAGISLAQYQSMFASSGEELQRIWKDEQLGQLVPDWEPAKHFAHAETYIDLAQRSPRTSDQDNHQDNHQDNDQDNHQDNQWTLYGQAAATLAAAQARCQTGYDKIKMYIARGDVEWLRLRVKCEAARVNGARLAHNAAQLYTNAQRVSVLGPSAETVQALREARVKLEVLTGQAMQEPRQEGADMDIAGVDTAGLCRRVGPQAAIIVRDMAAQGLIDSN